MTKKEAEALRKEIAKLREKVEALEKEPRKYEFHYHPPIFVIPTPFIAPFAPYAPPLPWWTGGTICGASGGCTVPASGGTGPFTTVNRLEASCVN